MLAVWTLAGSAPKVPSLQLAYDANYRPLVVPEVITWSGNGSGTWFLLQNHPRSILDWRKILPSSCFDGVQGAEANGAGYRSTNYRTPVPIIEHQYQLSTSHTNVIYELSTIGKTTLPRNHGNYQKEFHTSHAIHRCTGFTTTYRYGGYTLHKQQRMYKQSI